MNSENEKQYLSWYYESLKSISKIQARLAWIIFLLLAFSILLDKQSAEFIKIPLINLDLNVKTIQIIIPLILSIIYWEYLGSMCAASIAVKNIQFRLNNLKFKDQEFHLYDVDTSLNLLDLITFNFRKFIDPGTNIDNKKYDWRHLPYLSYALLFIGVKIYLLVTFTGCIYVRYFYFAPLIILDVIFSYPLIKNRIKRFFTG